MVSFVVGAWRPHRLMCPCCCWLYLTDHVHTKCWKIHYEKKKNPNTSVSMVLLTQHVLFAFLPEHLLKSLNVLLHFLLACFAFLLLLLLCFSFVGRRNNKVQAGRRHPLGSMIGQLTAGRSWVWFLCGRECVWLSTSQPCDELVTCQWCSGSSPLQ